MTKEQQDRIEFDHEIMGMLSGMKEYTVIGITEDGVKYIVGTSLKDLQEFLDIGQEYVDQRSQRGGGLN